MTCESLNIQDFFCSNLKRGTIISLILLLLQSCKYNVALIRGSAEINKTPEELELVKKLRHTLKSDSLIITYKSGKVQTLACEALWGIKYKDGTLYRYYKDQYYLIKQNADILVYSQTHSGYKSSYTSYYFSKGLDNDIHALKWKSIKKEFTNDTCFMRKIDTELKWYQDYSSYDRKNKTYRINTFYRQCKKNKS